MPVSDEYLSSICITVVVVMAEVLMVTRLWALYNFSKRSKQQY
jgi:hypothetical protein